MKQPRKLTRVEKIAVAASGRDPKEYALERKEGGLLYLVHKQTGKREFVAV